MLKSNKQKKGNNDGFNEEVLVDLIKKRKMYFVCDMDEESEYLHEMALQGYYFVKKKGSLYYFQQGEPKNYFYHLAYNEHLQDEERYVQNYEEAGWKNVYQEVSDFGGMWNYFCIEMPVGEKQPILFGDDESRLSLYQRLLNNWKALLILIVICLLFIFGYYSFIVSRPSPTTQSFVNICATLACILLLIFIIYFRSYIKISRKKAELKKKR